MRRPSPFKMAMLWFGSLAILAVVDGWSFSERPEVPTLLGPFHHPLNGASRSRNPARLLDTRTVTRHKFLQSLILSTIGVTVGTKHSATATATATPATTLYERTATGIKSHPISYQLRLPNRSSSFQESQKPVKTHLDEVNLISDSIKGYQYGITVDPVRINSLKEFGTPEEVAARVVTAEVNRDGIFEVTLMDDPMASSSDDGAVAYLLHYLSIGKRGNKHIWNKIIIQNQLLYVLTAQCKEGDYEGLADEMKQTVASLQVQSP